MIVYVVSPYGTTSTKFEETLFCSLLLQSILLIAGFVPCVTSHRTSDPMINRQLFYLRKSLIIQKVSVRPTRVNQGAPRFKNSRMTLSDASN